MSSRTEAVGPSAAQRSQGSLGGAFERARAWASAHQHRSAALVLALFVLAYLWPVLIGGEMLSPTTWLYQVPPWQTSAQLDVLDYSNFLLSDIPMAHYPWNALAREFVQDGVFPAWSQHAFAGTPFFANPQTVLLSPFSIPMWILPLNYALGVMAALKLWVAAFGTYLLVRELRLGFWPGLLAGVSYALCSFNVVWLTHETLPAVAALLPWTILLVERILRTGRPAFALWLAPVTAVLITGGHPGTAVHALVATGLYALVRVCLVTDLELSDRARRFGLAVGGLALGGLLIAVLVVPTMRGGAGTIGAEARTGGEGTMPGVTMPFEAIRTAAFPDWWGRPSDHVLGGPANYNERTFYAGAVAAFFALFALISPGAWRRKAAFCVIGAIGLAVPLHAPVVHWLVSNLPIIETVQNQRMLLLFAFAVPVIGAFGLQRLLELGRPDWRAWTALGIGAAIALFGVSSASGANLGDAISNMVSGVTHGEPGTLILTSVGWWTVFVLGVGIALLVLVRRPRLRTLVAVGIVGLAAFDMLHFAGNYQPMAPASKLVPPTTPAIEYLKERRADGRIVGLDFALTQNWSATYELRDVRGYDPPQPSLRWYRMWQSVNMGQVNWMPFSLSTFDRSGLNVLGVLGTRFIVGAPDLELPFRSADLTVGYRGDDATVLVNRRAVPRALVPERVEVLPADESGIGDIGLEEFDPRRHAVVDGGTLGDVELPTGTGAAGTVAVTGETNSSVTLRASMQRRGLVVLNDAFAPGWTVTVDGRPATAVRTNEVMRGVVVGAGEHEVVWRYRVPGLRLGAALSVLALVVLAASSGLLLRARRRARRAAAPGG